MIQLIYSIATFSSLSILQFWKSPAGGKLPFFENDSYAAYPFNLIELIYQIFQRTGYRFGWYIHVQKRKLKCLIKDIWNIIKNEF